MSGPGVPKVLYCFRLQPTNSGCVTKATSRRKSLPQLAAPLGGFIIAGKAEEQGDRAGS